jgi:superfamily I DNA/RNA helicase
MTIEITDEDIAYAERLLLPEGSSFNEERRAFIRCLESRDVVACPGSGKTTALLAKILIMARKMPFEDGRGICVLTHTNVAIEEIMRRAGTAADLLFRYPNFFGTIQSFVNRFLAIPRFRSEFGKPIIAIDNDRFFFELKKYYDRDFNLKAWMEPHGGISTLSNYWLNPTTLGVGATLDEPVIKKLRPDSPTYHKICEIRKKILEKGILSFNDAYSISLRYLEAVPSIHNVFSNRFFMVFLDEAQDTYEYQFRVLTDVFQQDQVVIQYIGDPNQAIFSSTFKNIRDWSPLNPLHFSDSQRYGAAISTLLSSVRLQDDICLRAQYLANFPPCLFLSSAFQVSFSYTGFLRAGIFITTFKVTRTASQTNNLN